MSTTNIIIEEVKIFVKNYNLEKKLNFLEKILFKIIKSKKTVIFDPFNNNLNYLNSEKINVVNFTDDLANTIKESKDIICEKLKEEIDKFPELAVIKISEINFSDKYWKVFFLKSI